MIQKNIDRPKPWKLFLKLALFQLPIYVVLVGLGIFSLTFEQERQARETYAASIGNTAARAASALQKAENLQIADPALTEQIEIKILTMLGGNIAIRCAELVAQGKVQASYPSPVGCKVQSATTFYEFEVGGKRAATLRVGASKDILESDIQLIRRVGFIIFFIGFAAAILSSWVSFRHIVGRPLNALVNNLVTALEEAKNANRAKGQFLANISHEIRTPMNGIIGTAELLSTCNLSDRERSWVKTISASADSLLEIIEDILDFARLGERKLQLKVSDFYLPDTIYEATSLLSQAAFAKGVEVIVDYAPYPQSVFSGDEKRLRQIVINILGNAIKFTDQGRVVVSVKIAPVVDKYRLSISVKDTGIGIAQADLARIFDAFSQVDDSTTRNFGGSGLGLSITKELVDLMGGEISATSIPGEGSTFSFHLDLPLGKRQKTNAIVETLRQINTPKAHTILVIDDMQLNCEILEDNLRYWGFEVLSTSSADQALAVLDAHSAPVSCIISDYTMPQKSGSDFARALKQKAGAEAPPIVLFSSSNILESFRDGEEELFADFLLKPVRPALLVRTLLRLYQPSNELTDGAETDTVDRIPDLTGCDVLVVDDNEINRNVFASQLAPTNATVRCATNGKEFLEMYREKPADFVFLDLAMPVIGGIDAFECLREWEMKEELEPNIVYAVSADALEARRRQCLDVGMDGFISKPFRRELLYQVLEDALGGNKSNREEFSASEEAAVLDAVMITDLIKSMGQDGYKDSAKKLRADCQDLLGLVDCNGSCEDIAALAHSVAGAAGLLGLQKVSTTTRLIETEYPSKIERRKHLVAEFSRALDLTFRDLNKTLNQA